MVRMCDAKCDAYLISRRLRLWLRNHVFYCIMELSRVNEKRRYLRISLHTDSYYEARERLKHMGVVLDQKVADKMRQKLALKPFATQKELLQMRDEAIKEANEEYATLSPEASLLWEKQSADKLSLSNLNELVSALKSEQKQQPHHTIQEILDGMLQKSNNVKAIKVRKRNFITKMLSAIGLKLEDDYLKLHNPSAIQNISQNVCAMTNVQNANKNERIHHIKELLEYAMSIEPDFYKANVLALLPNIPKTKKSARKPHLPYSKEQLLEIFNPKHSFFKENPDLFYVCLIALFTGARQNAALTLQFDDIVDVEGLKCIHFQANNPIKQLKNDASERFVPIHDKLLNAGFYDYVVKSKAKRKAKGTDFIFPKCETKGHQFNNKLLLRTLFPFLKDIGIKSGAYDQYDFHSFRKNASLIMQDAGIGTTYINNIIGWEGKGTMEQSYSDRKQAEIKEQMDKFSYDFLQPHFDAWKQIMAKK